MLVQKERFFAEFTLSAAEGLRMTQERLVILNPSTVTLSNAKSLRTSSVKDLS